MLKLKIDEKILLMLQNILIKIYTDKTKLHYLTHDISAKLNRTNAFFFIKKYVSVNMLGSTYFGISGSHLNFFCLIWAQNSNSVYRLEILQKKSFE